MTASTPLDAPIPFGIQAETGLPLNSLEDSTIGAEFGQLPVLSPELMALQSRGETGDQSFAVGGGIDANDLGQAGWGVIYSAGVSAAVKEALQPLLDHRKAQAAPYFVVFDGAQGYLAGDTAADWLKRRNVRMDVVEPELGVPFYLLLVGPPEEIPFEFQYSLDIYFAVGRLWFDTPEAFGHYAQSVIRYETPTTPVPTAKRAVLFATEHELDAATQLFTRQVAQPLAVAPDGSLGAVWKRTGFALNTCLGDQATKAGLIEILRNAQTGPPALLFSGSHGMSFAPDNPLQTEAQGAIVCQDWDGPGTPIKAEHWFAAADVPPDANLQGMMHFFFACYGGGCPAVDNFDRLNNKPRQIAKQPFFSRLPQQLLSHPQGGSLAVLAHIERAWAYSFQGQKGGSQIQGFRDVIGRLLRGERIGQATDMFNIRWAAISTELSDLQNDIAKGENVLPRSLGNLWVARDDARNFMILGDPAVRLRVEDMVAP